MKKIIILTATHILFLLIGGILMYSSNINFNKSDEEKYVAAKSSIRVCNLTDTELNLGFFGENKPNFPEIQPNNCSEYKDIYELNNNHPFTIITFENDVRNRYIYTIIDNMEASEAQSGKYTLTITQLNEGKVTIERQDAIKFEMGRDGDF